MLKFYKSELNAPGHYEARLDYDLNDPCPDAQGDRQIDVDRGFINMRATDPGRIESGVWCAPERSRTSTGSSPRRETRFASSSGTRPEPGKCSSVCRRNPDPTVALLLVGGRRRTTPVPEGRSDETPPGQSHHTVASTAFRMAVEYARRCP